MLRAAGKGAIANLIEELYGPVRELSTVERELLRDYAATKDKTILDAVRTMLAVGAKEAQKGGRKRTGGGGGGGGTGGTGSTTGRPATDGETEIPKEPERVHIPSIYQHRTRFAGKAR